MIWKFDLPDNLQKQLTSFKKKNPRYYKMLTDTLNKLQKGKGNVERLKHFQNRDVRSIRVDKKNRLVFEVIDEKKEYRILSLNGHYQDK